MHKSKEEAKVFKFEAAGSPEGISDWQRRVQSKIRTLPRVGTTSRVGSTNDDSTTPPGYGHDDVDFSVVGVRCWVRGEASCDGVDGRPCRLQLFSSLD